MQETGITGCVLARVAANADERGCLYEIFRQSWPGAFPTVQWNACASSAGVVRGAHVHADYDEFYTLPKGQVMLGLSDIRRNSPSFGKSVQIGWADSDGFAVVIPAGVAHVVRFEVDSVLVFGLSGYWRAALDVLGCQWDDPAFGFDWADGPVRRSQRDVAAGSYQTMVARYEDMARQLAAERGP